MDCIRQTSQVDGVFTEINNGSKRSVYRYLNTDTLIDTWIGAVWMRVV